MIKLLIGGSPCTYWSVAQKANREVEAKGMGWELFRNYLIAKEKFKPDFFLYENNKSAAQPIKEQISRELDVELMYINSALVSAQNRQRFYAFNWEVDQPEDRGILLKDILEWKTEEMGSEVTGVGFRNRREADGKLYRRYETDGDPKSNALTTVATDSMVCIPVYSCALRGRDTGATYEVNTSEKANTLTATGSHHLRVIRPAEGSENGTVYKVQNGLIEIKGILYPINLPDGEYIFRHYTPVECERLQTLPDGYTKAVSKTQRRKGLGNGWTAEVIIHILNGALKDVPRDEEIVVLSMYDGIGTGRYCLDKMGFTNITYYAYEIDEPAMKVALSNYPDIIQLGDAFNLRRDDWELGKVYNETPSAEKTEQESEPDELTDLSDAPKEIKEKIMENAEKLKKMTAAEETPAETTETKNETPTAFNAVEQLKALAEERKLLALINTNTPRFDNDVRAIEYAVSVLEAVGL